MFVQKFCRIFIHKNLKFERWTDLTIKNYISIKFGTSKSRSVIINCNWMNSCYKCQRKPKLGTVCRSLCHWRANSSTHDWRKYKKSTKRYHKLKSVFISLSFEFVWIESVMKMNKKNVANCVHVLAIISDFCTFVFNWNYHVGNYLFL